MQNRIERLVFSGAEAMAKQIRKIIFDALTAYEGEENGYSVGFWKNLPDRLDKEWILDIGM